VRLSKSVIRKAVLCIQYLWYGFSLFSRRQLMIETLELDSGRGQKTLIEVRKEKKARNYIALKMSGAKPFSMRSGYAGGDSRRRLSFERSC
jgi:hypothetical protein